MKKFVGVLPGAIVLLSLWPGALGFTSVTNVQTAVNNWCADIGNNVQTTTDLYGLMPAWVLTSHNDAAYIGLFSSTEFDNCIVGFNEDISGWDVTWALTMESWFFTNMHFTRNLDNWAPTKVTSMQSMFKNGYFTTSTFIWGDLPALTTTNSMFWSAQNFNPGLFLIGGVTSLIDLGKMFRNAIIFNPTTFSITGLDAANIDMSSMFSGATAFDSPGISDMDTTNVVAMDNMFTDATSFNQDLKLWNTASVTSFAFMFKGATSFSHHMSLANWKLDGLPAVDRMFSVLTGNAVPETLKALQCIWDQRGFNVEDMICTGGTSCSGGYHTLDCKEVVDTNDVKTLVGDWCDPETTANREGTYGMMPTWNMWNCALGTDCTDCVNTCGVDNDDSCVLSNNGVCDEVLGQSDWSGVFYDTTAKWTTTCRADFNQDISNWYTESVTDMQRMFQEASAFNRDLSAWNVDNVVNMMQMFNGASLFDPDLFVWDAPAVTTTYEMFYLASEFSPNTFKLTGVISLGNLQSMFGQAVLFNPTTFAITGLIANNIDMSYMFYYATAFNSPGISDMVTDSVSNMAGMFTSASSFNRPLNTWNTDNVNTMEYMFQSATSFVHDTVGFSWNVPLVTTTEEMFNGATKFNPGTFQLTNADSLVNLDSMFKGATSFNPATFSITGLSANNIDMGWMFYSATAFDSPGISLMDTTTVVDMNHMFKSATSFNQLLNAWGSNVANVVYMNSMFEFATSFVHNTASFSWIVPAVTTTYEMFNGATVFAPGTFVLTSAGSLTELRRMFWGATLFAPNTFSITGLPDDGVLMGGMFQGTSFNPNTFELKRANDDSNAEITDMSHVIGMGYMFSNAASFGASGRVPSFQWNVQRVADTAYMFAAATAFAPMTFKLTNAGSLTELNYMFQEATEFAPTTFSITDLPVTGVSAEGMFIRAALFNPSNLFVMNTVGFVNMGYMFSEATAFNQPLTNWNTASATTMRKMFWEATAFDNYASLNDWVINADENAGGDMILNMFDRLDGDVDSGLSDLYCTWKGRGINVEKMICTSVDPDDYYGGVGDCNTWYDYDCPSKSESGLSTGAIVGIGIGGGAVGLGLIYGAVKVWQACSGPAMSAFSDIDMATPFI